MRADPDGPSTTLREPTIRIVVDRLVSVEFFPADHTEPFVLVDADDDFEWAGREPVARGETTRRVAP